MEWIVVLAKTRYTVALVLSHLFVMMPFIALCRMLIVVHSRFIIVRIKVGSTIAVRTQTTITIVRMRLEPVV